MLLIRMVPLRAQRAADGSSVSPPQLRHEHGEDDPQGEIGGAEGNGEPQGCIVNEGDEIHELGK